MISLDQLRDHTSRRPFVPFWIRLSSGETLDITKPFRAIVTRREMVVSTDGQTMRHLPLDQIADHGLIPAGSN